MHVRARSIVAVASAVCAAGCEQAPFYLFDAAGRQAEALAILGFWVLGTLGIVIVGMGVLILWGALRRRGNLAEHLPIDADRGKAWILIGGVGLPLVVLTAFFFATLGTLGAMPNRIPNPDLTVDVTANQWWWGIEYRFPQPHDNFALANEIHVPVGETVQVELRSGDVIHSFWVPKLFGKIDAIPGHTNYVAFEAREPGVYWGECAEYCGLQHAHMRFVVVAHERAEFDAWVEAQRRPAVAPSDPLLTSGRNAFEQYACGLCHRIRGTEARGGVAPDLTHFGSRRTIGAGRLRNDRARLQAWIVNAQALKPGIEMPTLEQFDGRTLNALAAYLSSLE